MTFQTLYAARPLAAVVQHAQQILTSPRAFGSKSLTVITGRGRAQTDHADEITSLLASQGYNPGTGAEMRKTLGDAATGMVVAGPGASFLVIQAGVGVIHSQI